MRVLFAIAFLLVPLYCDSTHIAVAEGTHPWIPYTNLTMSYGYNNTMAIDAGNTTSHVELDLMLCDEQYESGDEICCIV